MSMNFGLLNDEPIGGATYLPTGGPHGSIYQPTAFMPKDDRAGIVSGGNGPIPGPSNFAGTRRPRDTWNTRANFGNPLDIFVSNQNNSTG